MLIQVKVKPNSKENKIIAGEIMEVFLKSPAENNRANIELIKLLKKYYHSEVRIIKGLKSKNKIIEIKDL